MSASETILICASSPIEFWSALACLSDQKGKRLIFVSDEKIIYAKESLAACEAVTKQLFPDALFVLLPKSLINSQSGNTKGLWWVDEYKRHLNRSLRQMIKGSDPCSSQIIDTLYFSSISHSYVRACLGLWADSTRILFPHGLDCPRDSMCKEVPWLYQPRSFLNLSSSFFAIVLSYRSSPSRNAHISRGELVYSLARTLTRKPRTCIPYSGTDRILTFRADVAGWDAAGMTHIASLKRTLREIAESKTFFPSIEAWRGSLRGNTVIMLLSEYERAPIFKHNTAWIQCLSDLAKKVVAKTRVNHLTIKSHPRSDGIAAEALAASMRAMLPGVCVTILPRRLAILPIEVFSLEHSVVAACSLGSASLPSDIGLPALPHYTSSSAVEAFDKGWIGTPFWFRFGPFLRREIQAGRFQDLDVI